MNSSPVKLTVYTSDNTKGFYKPGEVLSATVVIELTQPTKVNGLRVQIFGRSLVTWMVTVETEGRDQSVYTAGKENYLTEEFYVFGSESGPAIELSVGRSSYPFSIQLPLNLPSTFKQDWGSIRYTIEAIFDRPWSNDYETSGDFIIRSDYDLNQKSQASLAIHEEIHKRFCCCCICPWGKVRMIISVPSSGFVPGQMIPVTVKCENKSDVNVSKIKLYLRRRVKLYVTTPKRGAREKDDTMAENICENPFLTTFEDHVTTYLVVPQLPPSGLEFCGIIDLNYILKVTICFSGMHCSVERSFPILIGTIPLQNYSDTTSPVVTAPTPSAPLLREIPSVTVPTQSSGMPQPAPFYDIDPGYAHSRDLYPPPYEASTSGALRFPGQSYGAIDSMHDPPAYKKL